MVKHTIKSFVSLNCVLPYSAVKLIDHDLTEIVSIHVLQNVFILYYHVCISRKTWFLASCLNRITETLVLAQYVLAIADDEHF